MLDENLDVVENTTRKYYEQHNRVVNNIEINRSEASGEQATPYIVDINYSKNGKTKNKSVFFKVYDKVEGLNFSGEKLLLGKKPPKSKVNDASRTFPLFIDDKIEEPVALYKKVNGDTLENLLRKGLSDEQKISIQWELLKKLDDLHNRYQVYHGDIKLDNIMVDIGKDGKVVSADFIDFGLSGDVNNYDKGRNFCIMHACPEIYSDMIDGKKSDIYSLGLVFASISTGYNCISKPFHDFIGETIRIKRWCRSTLSNFPSKEEFYTNITSQLKSDDKTNNLISNMLKPNPLERDDLGKIREDFNRILEYNDRMKMIESTRKVVESQKNIGKGRGRIRIGATNGIIR
ncbi:MAG: protein kinase [Rickettsiales bacterium]|jgi:serine/threonine protein kinase|nr:protein kinase [Rickettsiales bacterium]